MTRTICAKTLLVGFLYSKSALLLHPNTGFESKLLRTSEMVVIALVAASLAAGGVFAVVLSPPPSPCSGATGAIRSFTIFFQAEDGIRGHCVTGVQTCALPI